MTLKYKKIKKIFGSSLILVHVFSTASCRTRAADLDILDGEFVVIGHLFTRNDAPKGKYDDMFFAPNLDNFGVAIWLEKKTKNN